MDACVKAGTPIEPWDELLDEDVEEDLSVRDNIVATLQCRWNVAMLAEAILATMRLACLCRGTMSCSCGAVGRERTNSCAAASAYGAV